MADRVRKINYTYVKVPHRPGKGIEVLGALREAGVNLTAFSAFPAGGGKAQVDLVTDDLPGLRKVARRNGWRLKPVKRGFLVQGDDRIGAVHRVLAKLASARINAVAADAVTAGRGRYGMILWVRPKDFSRAARALGAR
ncbi:MAG: hypothetical protein ABI836_04475 [Gemmatimonadota bacterium]